MKTIAILAAAGLASASAASLSTRGEDYLLQESWQSFKTKFNKTYATAEEDQARFEVFMANVERAAAYQKADPTAEFGITKFSDLTEEEFRDYYLTYSHRTLPKATVLPKAKAASIPTSFDWFGTPYTTPVKDQGQCGSCWAFSCIATLESASALAGHPLQELSPQALVSCDSDCYGCGGCWTYTALDWIIENGGAPTIESYPYTSGTTTVNGKCMPWEPAAYSALESYEYATAPCNGIRCLNQDATQVATVIATEQPLSVCVDASKWSMYKGGVMTSASCSSSALKQDHCVQLTGYSNWGSSEGYWIVRNQWGTGWGEEGFIYLSTNSDNGNTCGVLNTAIHLTVA